MSSFQDFYVGSVPMPVAEPGSYVPRGRSYRSIIAFMRKRPERVQSAERDFGLRWRDRGRLYRAAWIEDTGELYIVQLGEPSGGGGHVELLVDEAELDSLQEALAGWELAQDDGDDSLRWLRERARSAASQRARLVGVA